MPLESAIASQIFSELRKRGGNLAQAWCSLHRPAGFQGLVHYHCIMQQYVSQWASSFKGENRDLQCHATWHG